MVGLRLALLLILFPSIAFAQEEEHIVMIMGDDALRGHIEIFRTSGVDEAFASPGDTNTPNLDLVANAGVIFDHVVTAQLCTPSRAILMGFGWQYMPTNLMSPVQDMDVPIGHTLEVVPYIKTLVDYAHDLGWVVAIYGKVHLARLSWREQTDVEDDTPGASDVSWVKAMGFDRANIVMGNTRHVSYLGPDVQ